MNKKLKIALDNIDDNTYIVCTNSKNQPRMKVIVCKSRCKKFKTCKIIRNLIND